MNYKLVISKLLLASFTIFYTIPIFFYEDGSINSGLFIFTLIISALLFLLLVSFNNRTYQVYQSLNTTSLFRFVLILFLLLIVYSVITISTYSNFTGFFNRSTRNSELLQGNLYVILDIILKSIFFYVLSFCGRYKKTIIFLLLFSFLFDFSYLGARRTSVFILLMFLWTKLDKVNKSNFIKILTVLLVFGISSFLFSGYRELIYSGLPATSLTQILAASFYTNEFQVVSLNLLDYIKYTNSVGINPFEILLSLFVIFIPRFIWTTKPLTLDKKLDIFPNIFGQLYYNYGYLSIVVFLLILFFLLHYISKNYRYSMLIFAMIPDLFRTTFDQFLFVIALHILFIKLFTSLFTKRQIKL